MNKQQKPTLLIGALVGLLLSLPLIAIFYLAFELAGTPFVPFDVFDWVARILPGALIEFVISTMVSLITTFNLGETSSAAKTAEHIQAVGGLVITGIIAGAVLFEFLRRVEVKSRYRPGLITGLAVGVPVMFISTSINKSASASMFVSGVWILVAFSLWGLAFSWVYNRLTQPAPQPLTASGLTVQQIDRRSFLITLGGATAAITVVGTGIGALLQQSQPTPEEVALSDGTGTPLTPWSATNALPNANDPIKPVPGTRPEFTPLKDHYRIDINALPPVVKEDEWTLKISGLVEKETELTLNDIRKNYEPVNQFVTLACISNPLGGSLTSTQRWTGASLQKVMADAKLKPEATHLKITSADGFDEFVDLETINKDERVMLTYAWDGLPLETSHGFPLRIYIPNHYGMKQPKWITNIEAVDQWQEGYWVRRGWDKDAFMQATSVIDVVAADMVITATDNTMKVPVGGIAHAGSRGISKVEVRVDNGDWIEAQLRSPISGTTWVIWRYEWPFQKGEHTFEVHCVDGEGTSQIETPADVAPSGATGIDSMDVAL
jgi:DMSO/TMAO reductase YedYZ molybdopterin-dependent catalytic subunit